YTDGSRVDVTANTQWSSGTSTVGTIQSSGSASPGVFSPQGTGNTLITAIFAGTSQTMNLYVTGTTLSSINVWAPQVVLLDDPTTITAMGAFSDGTVLDVTDEVTWNTSSAVMFTSQRTIVLNSGSGSSFTLTANSGSANGSSTFNAHTVTSVSPQFVSTGVPV